MARANPERFIEAALTATSATEAPDPTLCPRCQRPLMDPFGLGLCSACGYCHSLQATRSESEKPQGKKKEKAGRKAVPAEKRVRRLPQGVLIPIIGAGLLLAVALAATLVLPVDAPLRLYFGRLAALVGLLAVAGAHFVAYRRAGKARAAQPAEEDRSKTPVALSLLAVVVIWRGAWTTRPRSRWLFAGLAWGLALLLGGAVVRVPLSLAGFATEVRAQHNVADARMRSQREQAMSVENQQARDKLVRLTGQPGKPGYRPRPVSVNPTPVQPGTSQGRKPRPVEEDPRPTVPCLILGYTTNPSHQLTGLVIATLLEGRLVPGGVVTDGLDLDLRVTLHVKLDGLKRAEAAVPVPGVNAVWVTPRVFCEIHHSGPDDAGLLSQPRYRTLIDD